MGVILLGSPLKLNRIPWYADWTRCGNGLPARLGFDLPAGEADPQADTCRTRPAGRLKRDGRYLQQHAQWRQPHERLFAKRRKRAELFLSHYHLAWFIELAAYTCSGWRANHVRPARDHPAAAHPASVCWVDQWHLLAADDRVTHFYQCTRFH